MAEPTQQALKASSTGIEQAKSACLSSASKITQLRQLHVSRATMQQFFTGQPIDQSLFHKICRILELNWQDIADLSDLHIERIPEDTNGISHPLPGVASTFNRHWQKLKAQVDDSLRRNHERIELLNLQTLPIMDLEFDLYIVEKLSRDVSVNVTTYLKSFDPREDFDRFGLGDRNERLNALEAAKKYPRLIVLGQPAAGKTTFLKYLAIACCQNQYGEYIPIFLDLKSFSTETLKDANVLELIIQQSLNIEQLHEVQEILDYGHLLILIDGLEGISDEGRKNVQFQLRTFTQRYNSNRFVIACRTQFTDYTLPTFRHVEIADLNLSQINAFVQAWFKAELDTSATHEITQEFMSELALEENHKFFLLAQKPQLLQILCWIFQYLGRLPATQFEFYELGLTRILEVAHPPFPHHEPTIYLELDLAERYRLLSYLAILTFEKKELFIQFKKLKSYINLYLKTLPSFSIGQTTMADYAKRLLSDIEMQHGIIFQRSPDLYSFASPRIQEYLVGYYLLRNFDPNFLKKSLGTITNKNWYELFSYLTQQVYRLDDFLLHIKHKIDQIVARDKKIQIFLSWVNQKAILVKVPYKIAAVRAFYFSQAIDRIFDPRISRPLDFSHAVNRALKSSLHDWSLACHLDRELDYAFSHNVIDELDPEFVLDLILNCLLVTFAHDLSLFMTFAEDRNLTIEPELKLALHRFQNQLPKGDRGGVEYQQWWRANSQIWIRNLRLVIIEHRNVGYDWQFNRDQQALLRQYYNANKLLVECLYNNPRVAPQTVQELEETLLLPISDIRSRHY
ncbi:MAG: NACHT domain-containing protein [Spirulina sp. DLM2.Bin59]|nr:MAG: NACHT domain-containing protein [Spirulina sp. DLM2.Bin59]